MATPTSRTSQAPAPETPSAQRAALVAVTSRMLEELRAIWPQLPRGVELQPTLRYQVLPAVVAEYGDAAAALAADWYDTLRDQLGVRGRFTAQLAPPPPEDMLRAVSNWIAEVPETAQERAEAASQKIVTDMSRQTVQVATEHDPNARGWARFTDDDACGFCRMLASRGGVYTSASVKFGSHDRCHCLAGPVWNENREWVGEYRKSPNVTDAQREGAKKWIRENYGKGGDGSGATKPAVSTKTGLKAMSDDMLRHDLALTEGLKDTAYKREHLARLRAEMKRRGLN